MPLSAGDKLGVYEILSPLGAGGMGEVYRALDSKLGREVAIKVLPEEFTQHPQKLARFEREARLLAALNHPGIATLHGLEESEGKPFLVMELVEGETLADRIARGPIPVEEALTISQQIAEALEAAHEKGGEDVSDVLASIIKLDIDWRALPSDLDPRIQKLLVRCLKQDRKKRLRDVGDLRNEIEEILADPGGETAQQPVAVPARSRARLLLAWGLSILATAIAVWIVTRPGSSPPETVMRFSVTLPEGVSFVNTSRQLLALSLEGTRLVYVANGQLYLREMAQMEAAPIRGTDSGPFNPFFSPDGQWVGFYAADAQQLKKVAVTGGAPITLCDAGNPNGASWGVDDMILLGQGPAGILRVSANGGTPEILIPMDSEKDERAQGPQMLPDGESVLFALTTTSSWDDAQIVAQSLETGERRVLIEGGTDARYVPTGHLVYASGDTLLAVAFDVERLEVTGGPVPVVEGVARTGGPFGTGGTHASFSDSGSLVYVSGVAQTLRRLAWVDREGGEAPLPGQPGDHAYPRLSPDGERLAVIDRGDVWIHSMDRGTSTRLTFTGDNQYLVWTPDGERVIFSSSRAGVSNLFWKSADGSDEAEQLLTSQFEQHPDSISPDGRLLAFHQHDPGNGTDLWVVSLDGDGEPQPFLQTPYNERGAVFSPNARWLAYGSDESGQNEVYVQPFPGPGGKYQISREGGDSPVWNRNGRELFYRGPNNEMMVVDIAAESGLTAGTPRLLFEKMRPGPPLPFYDVSPDSERFIMSLPDQNSAGTLQINVVLNWFQELKRLVPTD